MLIHCKYCQSKFAINAEEVGFDGRLVKCENCQKEWFQESKSKSLEKKLIELDRNLLATEQRLTEQKNNHNDKILKLEKSLKAKKEELEKQKLLEDLRTVNNNNDHEKLRNLLIEIVPGFKPQSEISDILYTSKN